MKVRLYAKDFKRVIDNTKRFVSTGFGSGLMQWIYLEINADKRIIKASALDGHRISIEYASVESADESFSCYIKPNIPKINRFAEYADLWVEDKRLFVQVGESIMGYVQPDGEFYKLDILLKSIQENKRLAVVGVNAKFLKDAMESISDHGSKKIVRIDLYDSKSPIVIRSVEEGARNNLKIVLPVNFSDCVE